MTDRGLCMIAALLLSCGDATGDAPLDAGDAALWADAASEPGATRRDAEAMAESDGGGGAGAGGAAAQPSDAGDATAGPEDAGGPQDGAPDSTTPSGCADCQARGECESARCEQAECVHSALADGAGCAAGARLCVAGECVARGCGNAYREQGPEREACDDGNLTQDDACDSACRAQALVLASRDQGFDTPAGPAPAVAEDGRGRLLFVWLAEQPPPSAGADPTLTLVSELRAGSGASLPGGRQELAADLPLGWALSPVVAGLAAGGFVVAWVSPTIDDDLGGIAYRGVSAAGELGATQRANEEAFLAQRAPAASAYGAGFVLAWTDESEARAGDDLGSVRARFFEASGAPLGDELTLPAEVAGDQQAPALAVVGETLLVAFTHRAAGEEAEVRGRRLRMTGALDARDVTLVSGCYGASAAALPEVERFVIACTDAASDAAGDVTARTLAAGGEARLGALTPIASTAGHAELSPAVAALRGGDYLVAWQDGGERRGLGLAVSAPEAGVPEDAALGELLQLGSQGDVSLARTSRGVWLVWSDAGALGHPGARRSTVAYLRPLD